MWDLHTTTDMSFFLLVCLLSWSGMTSADETGFFTVAEGDDAVLPCSLKSKENIEQMTFDWRKDGEDRKEVFYYVKGEHYNNGRSGQDPQFKGRVSHFQNELKFGNASIKIRNTELADNGRYTCDFLNKQTIFSEKQTSHITLYVDAELKERHVPGAAPKPDVTSLEERENYTLLQCKVHGVPEPTVEWKDSGGSVLPAKKEVQKDHDGRFCITLQVNVTNSDRFICVATQEEIHHQINGTISVYVQGEASRKEEKIQEISTGWIIGVALPCTLLFLVLFVIVLLFATGHLELKSKSKPGQNSNLESEHLNSNSPSGQITHQNNYRALTVPSTDDNSLVTESTCP